MTAFDKFATPVDMSDLRNCVRCGELIGRSTQNLGGGEDRSWLNRGGSTDLACNMYLGTDSPWHVVPPRYKLDEDGFPVPPKVVSS